MDHRNLLSGMLDLIGIRSFWWSICLVDVIDSILFMLVWYQLNGSVHIGSPGGAWVPTCADFHPVQVDSEGSRCRVFRSPGIGKKQVSWISPCFLGKLYFTRRGKFALITISSNMFYIALCLEYRVQLTIYLYMYFMFRTYPFQGNPTILDSWKVEGVPHVLIQLQTQLPRKISLLSEHANTATFWDMSPSKQS